MLSDKFEVKTIINGKHYTRTVEPRWSLCDFLRDELNLTGTHVGCEQGACGSCTVLVDGLPVRSCLMIAPQADGVEIETVEGLAHPNGELSVLQSAFRESHGLQCGFCTPGVLMTIKAFLNDNPEPDEQEIRLALSGNICRCTGYQHMVDAVRLAAHKVRQNDGARCIDSSGRECNG